MSSKPFQITPKEIEQGKIKFGKIESAKAIGSKCSRLAIGYEGMPESHLTCIPRPGTNYRDPNTCMYILFTKEYNMTALGLIPQYKFVPKKKTEQIPENIVGYNMVVPLLSRDTMKNPTEKEQQIASMLKHMHKAAQKFILANKASLPVAFRNLSDEDLKKRVQTIETPPKDEKYAPTLFAKVKYFPAKPADEKNKARPECFFTTFKGPGNQKLDPKSLVKVTGKVSFVLRVSHLNFITGDDEDSLKIKFDTELTEVNFTKTERQQLNMLGDNDDQPEEFTESKEAFDVDATKSYGDASSNYENDDEEEKPKKKKKHHDE